MPSGTDRNTPSERGALDAAIAALDEIDRTVLFTLYAPAEQALDHEQVAVLLGTTVESVHRSERRAFEAIGFLVFTAAATNLLHAGAARLRAA